MSKALTSGSGQLRVIVSSIGRFHMFDLARELQRQGCLRRLYTAYPRWKVDSDLLNYTSTFPWVLPLEKACGRLDLEGPRKLLSRVSHNTLDSWVARHLPPCDIVVALSKSGLCTFRAAKERGAMTVCDRGSSHIVYQDEILAEEYACHGIPYEPIPQWAVEKELQEYEETDLITVPSTFVYRSFVEKGVPESKLAKLPYGVDLSLFHRVPKEDDVFRVLYVGTMSLQKGIPYLLEAFATLHLPQFELVLIGGLQEEVKPFFERYRGGFRYLGFFPRAELYHHYSQASVFVIASIQEGLALVQAQAMACGLPVVATTNTGAEDLFSDGIEGFIVPIRDPEALREKVLYLYEHPEVRDEMAQAALQRVQSLGGWDEYGRQAVVTYRSLLERKRFAEAASCRVDANTVLES